MKPSAWKSARMFLIVASLGAFALGCSQDDPAEAPPTVPGKISVAAPTGVIQAAPDASCIPFAEAVRLEPPEGELRPPDATVTGKNPAKLFEAIASRAWEEVRFVAADGTRLQHFALVTTDAGDFKIELLQDTAPNHVRSFICLARAGYFDGLPFHTSVRRNGQGYLESGCPKGTGELGYGSIGYWLKPEIRSHVLHEAGAVGAWHPPEEHERAACRFYIALGKSTNLDGQYTIFGRVVHGLDVAHTINQRPVQDEEYQGPPQAPYRIRQVLIQQERTRAAASTARNPN